MEKVLKIGGFDWDVIKSNSLTKAHDSLGLTDFENLKIFLKRDLPIQLEKQTLLHEILHVVFWQSGLDERIKEIEGITEEELVSAISFGLYQVLKDNYKKII